MMKLDVECWTQDEMFQPRSSQKLAYPTAMPDGHLPYTAMTRRVVHNRTLAILPLLRLTSQGHPQLYP